jgi:hypothetical protein
VYHHKIVNYRWQRRFKAKYYLGTYDHMHGDLLLWEILRCIKELIDTPYFVGSCLRLAGYVKGLLSGRTVLSPEALQFVHVEQYRRIRFFMCGHWEAMTKLSAPPTESPTKTQN